MNDKQSNQQIESVGQGVQPESLREISRSDLVSAIRMFLSDNTDTNRRVVQSAIIRWVNQRTQKYVTVSSAYTIKYLMLERPLLDMDADTLYRGMNLGEVKEKSKKPILLILQSNGGQIEPAYFIGKLLLNEAELQVAVPRKAKSAASLICCAASKIHMGGLSELGPIDPQINGVPALGLKNAIQHIAELSSKYPDATDLFVGYMSNRVEPLDLGYYERVVESSMQYAIRLLSTAHKDMSPQDINEIARTLTYEYKDHGFVIDRQEAGAIFHSDTILNDTPAYRFSDIVYKEVQFIRSIAHDFGYSFSLVGSDVNAIDFRRLPKQRR